MDTSIITNRELFLILQKSTFFFDKLVDNALKKETDISLAQFDVLMAIFMSGLTTQQEISTMLHNTQASVSRQVSILLNKDYITRTQNPNNRREFKLKSTQSGNTLVKKATKILDQKFKEVFAIVSEKDKEKVSDVLNTIIQGSGKNHSTLRESATEIQKIRECIREGLKKL